MPTILTSGSESGQSREPTSRDSVRAMRPTQSRHAAHIGSTTVVVRRTSHGEGVPATMQFPFEMANPESLDSAVRSSLLSACSPSSVVHHLFRSLPIEFRRSNRNPKHPKTIRENSGYSRPDPTLAPPKRGMCLHFPT